MKFDNQLRYGSAIIAAYKGEMPLHAWLKDFFREHKQMGSRDRRQLSNMVYGFYRLGHAVRDLPVEERILTGLFLCNASPQEMLGYFKPDWNEQINRSLEEKFVICRESGISIDPREIFPWKEELSEDIDHYAFCLSFLRQPHLFLRIRPGQQEFVLQKLALALPQNQQHDLPEKQVKKQVPFSFLPPFTLCLPNGFKVEEFFTPDKEVVIQDSSSQRLASFLQGPSGSFSFWDACAASGGKAILAFDLNPGIDITVSDIRESILENLHRRFSQAGISRYHSFMADLSKATAKTHLPPGKFHSPAATKDPVHSSGKPGDPANTNPSFSFDLILMDVPCTGSGTWSRTPEELYFFNPEKIGRYSALQKKIVSNSLPWLAPGGRMIYSTCSVFKKENEEMVDFIGNAAGSTPERVEHINGYDQGADSMFAARFCTSH
ncbi:RsmB/NOP family class I SAM-dependent RNA methyltransferase [Flavitalea flava]